MASEDRPASSATDDHSTLHDSIEQAIAARDYATALGELERLLAVESPSERALSLCEKLLDVRAATAQAAALLSDAFGRLGRKSDEVAMLTRELRLARAERLSAVKLRLAALRSDFLDDDAGALELLEPLVAREPAYDEARQRYLGVSERLGREKEAARVLARSLRQAQSDAERARIGLDVGRAYLAAGDEAHAREAFAEVLAVRGEAEHALAAAQHLLIEREGVGRNDLVSALAAIALHDPSPGERQRAALELRGLAEGGSLEPRVEVAAHEALLGTPHEGDALARLEALYDKLGDRGGLAGVLWLRAQREPDRAALLARVATLRLESGDAPGALEAARECLAIDPGQAPARRVAEALLVHEQLRHAACRLLEPLCEADRAKSPEAAVVLLRILEIYAEHASPGAGPDALWSRAGRLLDDCALGPAERLRAASRFLLEVARASAADVPEWIARVERIAGDPAERAKVFVAVLESGVAEVAARRALTPAAARALDAAGRREAALPLYEQALATEPSPELLQRLDELSAWAGQSMARRIERYSAAIESAADAEQRAELLFALAGLQSSELGDLPAAVASLNDALGNRPHHFAAHQALLEAYAELGDQEAHERELSRALKHLRGAERELTLVRLAESLIARGRAAQALPLCRPLLDLPSTSDAALDVLERLCERTEDVETLRKVLERRVETAADAPARARALERLGEFFDEWLHDAERTSQAWKAAAEQYSRAPEPGLESQRVYERVLSASPGDSEAAARLVELYAASGDWARVPEAYATLVSSDIGAERAIELLLSLEPAAARAGAADEFGGLVDEALWRLGKAAGPSAHRLTSAKARVFAASERLDEAAAVYRAAIESFADPDDVRDFEALVERSPGAEWRQRNLRWLFQWRVARTQDPAPHLIEWAEREEREFSDSHAALRLLERALAADRGRADAWERLALLKIKSGDVDGGLSAIESLRELEPARDHRLEIDCAEVLLSRLDQPERALALLDRALDHDQDDQRARTLAHRALLAVARVAAECAVQDATWQTLEGLALELGDPELALEAYGVALEAELDADSAGVLGRRLLAFAEQHVENPKAVNPLLERAAELSPKTRDLFDRVKLLLIAEQRWSVLFSLYERAIEAAETDREQAELLDEAAIAARDVAGDVARAVSFFERYARLRPDDARADAALERLYERIAGIGREHGASDAQGAPHDVTARAVAFLEQRYRRLGRDLELAKVLELELASASDPPARARLLRELAELAEARLEDTLGACEHLGALLLLEPDQASLDKLAELAGRLGSDPKVVELWTGLLEEPAAPAVRLTAARALNPILAELWRPRERAGVLEIAAELEPEKAARREALREAGRVLLEELSEPEQAAAAFGKLLETDPDDAGAHDGLIEALRALDDPRALADALCARARLSPNADPRRDLAEAARIHASLGDRERAIEIWHALRSELGRDLESYRALAPLLEAAGRHAERAELLAEEAEAQSSPALYAALAELYRTQIGDRAAAVAAYIRAGDFRAAGELFAESDDLLGDDPRLSLDLARALEDRGHTDRAERILRRQIEHYGSRHPKERRQVEVDLANLLRRSARAEQAFALLSPVAELYPSDAELLYLLGGLALKLGELARAEQSYRSLLLVLHRQERAQGAPTRAEIYVELSEIAALRGQHERADDLVASAFEAAESPGDTLRALGKLVESRARRGPLDAAFKERVLEIATHASQALAAGATAESGFEEWLGLLSVYDRLGEPERAASFLDALIEAGKRELLRAKAAGETALADKLGLELGALLERAGRIEEALDVFHSLTLRAATRREALGAIVRLEKAPADPEKLGAALEQLIELEHGPEAVAYAARLVSLREAQGDEAGRERALVLGAAADPGRADFRDELLALYLERRDFENAVALLERAVEAAPADVVLKLRLAEAQRAQGDASRALATLDRIPPSKRGGPVLRERWQTLAALGRDEEALAELETGYAVDPRLAPELIAAIERLEARSSSEPRVLRLFELHAARGETDAARACVERCLERIPKAVRVRARAARFAAEQGDLGAAKRHYHRLASELPGELAPAESASLSFEAARLLNGEGDHTAALAAATKLVEIDPTHGEGLLLFSELLGTQGRAREALPKLGELALSKPRKPAKLLSRVYKRIGEIHLAEDELAEAVQAFGEAQKLDKQDLEVALLLGLVAMDLDDFETAGNALRTVIVAHERGARSEAVLGATAVSSAYFHLAWLDHGKGKKTSARRHAERAIEHDPQNRDARRLLSELGN